MAHNMTFAIVVSDYHHEITAKLLEGCENTLLERGAPKKNISIYKVPGAYELIAGATWASKILRPDAVITLGCVIKGETRHDEYINRAAADSLARLNTDLDLPVIFGLLTVDSMVQALDRAGGKYGNKGVECAHAAIEMVSLRREIFKDVIPF